MEKRDIAAVMKRTVFHVGNYIGALLLIVIVQLFIVMILLFYSSASIGSLLFSNYPGRVIYINANHTVYSANSNATIGAYVYTNYYGISSMALRLKGNGIDVHVPLTTYGYPAPLGGSASSPNTLSAQTQNTGQIVQRNGTASSNLTITVINGSKSSIIPYPIISSNRQVVIFTTLSPYSTYNLSLSATLSSIYPPCPQCASPYAGTTQVTEYRLVTTGPNGSITNVTFYVS